MSEQQTQNTPISTNELTARLQKAENIKARDGVVWKDKFDRTHTIEEARNLADNTPVKLAGRVTALRWLGKLMFGRIYDINGEIQFSMSREELGDAVLLPHLLLGGQGGSVCLISKRNGSCVFGECDNCKYRCKQACAKHQ